MSHNHRVSPAAIGPPSKRLGKILPQAVYFSSGYAKVRYNMSRHALASRVGYPWLSRDRARRAGVGGEG
jgi:hypothetical protein